MDLTASPFPSAFLRGEGGRGGSSSCPYKVDQPIWFKAIHAYLFPSTWLFFTRNSRSGSWKMAVDDSQETQSTSQTHDSHTSESKEYDSRPELDDEKKLPPGQVQQPLMYRDDDDDDDDDDDGLPSIGDDANHEIRFRDFLLKHAMHDRSGKAYWTRRLLRKIITEARLSNELARLQIKSTKEKSHLCRNSSNLYA